MIFILIVGQTNFLCIYKGWAIMANLYMVRRHISSLGLGGLKLNSMYFAVIHVYQMSIKINPICTKPKSLEILHLLSESVLLDLDNYA